MNGAVKIVVAVNLIVLAMLAFVYPQSMVGPGKLIPGHRQLEGDCFACHAPFAGAASERCASCHKPADIGRLTTAGKAIAKPLAATFSHQQLNSQDCIACHSDHAGVKRYRAQGRFDHALLQKETRQSCRGCHQAPTDALHRGAAATCGQCHSPAAWQPANFDHDKYFRLDRDHDDRCVTCHARNDYSRYTCYGCHAHTQANLRREHVEEGVRDYDNCIECHRSANEHDIRGGGGEREGRREGEHGRNRQHDDD